ncbi:MAG: ABC transporter permease [Acidobacteria bacterium]|nr:ABC transporter permease [Acidobacteriota bacterium]
MRTLWSKLKATLSRRRREEDLDDEIRFHIEMLVEENIARGMSPHEARQAARREFGGMEQIKEVYREHRGLVALENLLQEVRHAFRLLNRYRRFTAVTALTLALGIGATTAMFAVVQHAILRPLPFPHADRLVAIESTIADVAGGFTSAPGVFVDWRERSHTFERLAGIDGISTLTWIGSDVPRRLRVLRVSKEFFDVSGIPLLRGRSWTDDEDLPQGPLVAVVSEEFWRQDLAGDERVIGREIQLHDRVYTIVGVAPSGFRLGQIRDPEVLIPLQASRSSRFGGPVMTIGRLREGVSLDSARADMEIVMAGIRDESPSERGAGVLLTPLGDWVVGDMRLVFLTVLGAVGCLWLIGCANLANMQLARGSARMKETAVRAALGAGRMRIIRQILVETAVTVCVGGILGLGLAWIILGVLPTVEAIYVPRVEEMRVSLAVVGFAAAASALSVFLVGLAPAIQAARRNLNAALAGAGTLLGQSGGRLRGGLVISQLALSVVLLAGAGLLANSLIRLLNIDLGFERANAIAVEPRFYERQEPDAAVRFLVSLQAAIDQMPGVESTSMAEILPMDTRMMANVPLRIDPAREQPLEAHIRQVAPNYLHTLHIPLLAGRDLEPGDESRWPVPALLSQQAAMLFYGDGNPIGRRLFNGVYKEFSEMEVVGVVGEVRQRGIRQTPPPILYIPVGLRFTPKYVVARLIPGAPVPAAAIRQVLKRMDPAITVEITTLEDRFDEQTSEARFYFWLLGGFALSGLLIAAVGVYGVMAYAVAQRTHEFAVRIALGARGAQIFWRAVRSAVWMVAVGLGLGLLCSAVATRLLDSLLYQVEPGDPATLLGVALLLSTVALAAASLAARRVISTDPASALKQE